MSIYAPIDRLSLAQYLWRNPDDTSLSLEDSKEVLSKRFNESLEKYGSEAMCDFTVWSIKNRKIWAPPPQKIYEYFTTFTCKDVKNKDNLYNLLSRLHHRKALKIISYHLTKEHWDGSNPHIHTYIKTTKPLAKTNIKYYKKFGHIDHKPVTPGTQQQILEYLNKESVPEILV